MNELRRAKKRRYYLRHAASLCESARQYRKTNKQIIHEQQARQYHRDKIRVLRMYGDSDYPACACCGESRYEFLSIDHIKPRGSGPRLDYRTLVATNRDPNLQVLCHNCNQAKRVGEVCPHQSARFASLDEWWEWCKPMRKSGGTNSLSASQLAKMAALGRTLGRYRGICSRWHKDKGKNEHNLCRSCERAAQLALIALRAKPMITAGAVDSAPGKIDETRACQ